MAQRLVSLFLSLTLVPHLLVAAEINIKGFIALDMLVLKKIERQNQEFLTGVGVLDLRVYAQEGPLSSKIKLDLDDSNLGEPYNLFEEVLVYYRFFADWRVTAGKGKVPFHRLHWGVIENSYIDGGSVIGTNHSWRDVDNKILLSLMYGSYNKGFENHFTYWGDSQIPSTDRDGNLELDNGKIQYENSKTFSTKNQRGLANKIEFFPNLNLSYSLGAIYYHSDYDPRDRYALDTGVRWRDGGNEIWAEYVYGSFSTHPGARYAVHKVYENLFQLGFEKYLNESFNWLSNAEMALVDLTRHNDTTSGNDGSNREYSTYKLESGIKWKTTKSSFVTFGGLVEKQEYTLNGVDRPHTYAYELATKLSFWF